MIPLTLSFLLSTFVYKYSDTNLKLRVGIIGILRFVQWLGRYGRYKFRVATKRTATREGVNDEEKASRTPIPESGGTEGR